MLVVRPILANQMWGRPFQSSVSVLLSPEAWLLRPPGSGTIPISCLEASMPVVKRFCGAMLMIVLSAVLATAAGVTETLSPKVGPITTDIQVSGAGFPAATAVDIYFDATELALAVTNSSGAFSGVTIQVPSSAMPGTHWVTAVATGTSGEAAQAPFTVQANWAQFRYSQPHRGRNPYENVLNSTNGCQRLRHQRHHGSAGLEVYNRGSDQFLPGSGQWRGLFRVNG